MLQELRVKNYALLDNVQAPFEKGFNALTGETGAGKSLLAGALGLLLGQKANASLIREGCDEAEISGVLQLAPDSEAALWLKKRDIFLDEGALAVRRIIKSSGRSSIYLQSAPVTREELAELAALLFDMHGQHEHQSLYNRDNQRKILDKAAGAAALAAEYGKLFAQLKEEREALERLRQKKSKAIEEQAYLQFALDEIDETAPSLEAKQDLSQKLKQLESKERLNQSLERFRQLTTGQDGAVAKLKEAKAALKTLADLLSETDIARYESALLELEDVCDVLTGLRDGMSFSEADLEEMSRRLSAMQRLEKKHGGTMESLLKFADEARAKLALAEDGAEEERALNAQLEAGEARLRLLARQLSEKRKARAALLEKEAEACLKNLNMPNSRFAVQITEKMTPDGQKAISQTGMDNIEFLFSSNVGEPLKPLKAIASGGEASRVLLALKSAIADQDSIDCLIFDEIDTGIGGQAALSVARHMQKLARSKQILCITHLAAIAAHADCQLKIEKKTHGMRTITQVEPISKEERAKEIARMLSGRADESALAHACALLQDSARKG